MSTSIEGSNTDYKPVISPTFSSQRSLPFLGACHKTKGAAFTDCRKGMLINKAIRNGERLI